MNTLRSIATLHPVLFILALIFTWLVLLLLTTGIASGILRRPYGDAVTGSTGRLLVTAGVLWLAWRLGWLEAAGIARLGLGWVWLLTLGSMVYIAGASLYAFYGKATLDLPGIMRLSGVLSQVFTQSIVSLNEEILFRGVVLYTLARVWGHTRQGVIASVALAALLFAVIHLIQVFTNGVTPAAALLLTVQTWLIAMWWGALVLLGGSIWPAVLLHLVGNAVVALQGQLVPVVGSEVQAYSRLLWFSLPLGMLSLGLLLPAALRPNFSKVP
jgi:membrane protease YdiL (CAAX protease family)